jgi:hypothetical protein
MPLIAGRETPTKASSIGRETDNGEKVIFIPYKD